MRVDYSTVEFAGKRKRATHDESDAAEIEDDGRQGYKQIDFSAVRHSQHRLQSKTLQEGLPTPLFWTDVTFRSRLRTCYLITHDRLSMQSPCAQALVSSSMTS